MPLSSTVVPHIEPLGGIGWCTTRTPVLLCQAWAVSPQLPCAQCAAAETGSRYRGDLPTKQVSGGVLCQEHLQDVPGGELGRVGLPGTAGNGRGQQRAVETAGAPQEACKGNTTPAAPPPLQPQRGGCQQDQHGSHSHSAGAIQSLTLQGMPGDPRGWLRCHISKELSLSFGLLGSHLAGAWEAQHRSTGPERPRICRRRTGHDTDRTPGSLAEHRPQHRRASASTAGTSLERGRSC